MRKKEKKVSVIITTFKRSDYLLRAIKSVLSQTYRNIELIVVDDNDEDSEFRKANKELLKGLVHAGKIKYLKHKTNKNGAAARNSGIKFATGEYITFLDDDDFFLNDRVKQMVELLEKEKHFDCAYSDTVFIRKGKIVAFSGAHKKGKLEYDVLRLKSFFRTGSNLFFRKDAIEKVGFFDEGFIRHQDMEYMARFFKYGSIVNLREPLVVKCFDGARNVQSYEKMVSVKKNFLKKFKNEISSFSKQEQANIYFENYFELLKLTRRGTAQFIEAKRRLLAVGQLNITMRLRLYLYEIGEWTAILKFGKKVRSLLERCWACMRLSGELKRSIYNLYREKGDK